MHENICLDSTTSVWHRSLNDNEDCVCPKLKKLTIDCELNDKSNLCQFILKSNCNVLNNLNELFVVELSRHRMGNVSKVFNWLKKSLPNKNICNKLNTLSFEFHRDYSKRDHLVFSQSKDILNRCLRQKEELQYQIKHIVMKWTINNVKEANIYSTQVDRNKNTNNDDHDTKFTIDLFKKRMIVTVRMERMSIASGRKKKSLKRNLEPNGGWIQLQQLIAVLLNG